MDQIKAFGKAGSTFECQVFCPGALMEEVIQSPADPEIFLNDAFTEAAICCGNEELQRLRAYDSTEKILVNMCENFLIDKSITFAARIVKLHGYLMKSHKEAIVSSRSPAVKEKGVEPI